MLADVERLREVLAPGGGGVAALLAEHPDPTVRLISELWSFGGEEQEPEPEPAPKEVAGEAAGADELRELARREHALRRQLNRLHAELERLDDFIHVLAAALGACSRCWGEDAACSVCAGAGRPGSALPDRRLFRRYITPAVRRLGAARRAEPAGSRHHYEPPIEDRATTPEGRQS